jgi:hypothetical protein
VQNLGDSREWRHLLSQKRKIKIMNEHQEVQVVALYLTELERELARIRGLYYAAFGHRDRAFGASWTDPDGTDLAVMEYADSSGAILFETEHADQAQLIRALLNFAAKSAGCLMEE